jgi:hypothetical protein
MWLITQLVELIVILVGIALLIECERAIPWTDDHVRSWTSAARDRR